MGCPCANIRCKIESMANLEKQEIADYASKIEAAFRKEEDLSFFLLSGLRTHNWFAYGMLWALVIMIHVALVKLPFDILFLAGFITLAIVAIKVVRKYFLDKFMATQNEKTRKANGDDYIEMFSHLLATVAAACNKKCCKKCCCKCDFFALSNTERIKLVAYAFALVIISRFVHVSCMLISFMYTILAITVIAIINVYVIEKNEKARKTRDDMLFKVQDCAHKLCTKMGHADLVDAPVKAEQEDECCANGVCSFGAADEVVEDVVDEIVEEEEPVNDNVVAENTDEVVEEPVEEEDAPIEEAAEEVVETIEEQANEVEVDSVAEENNVEEDN